jgi:hypothetical protein
VRHLSVRNFHSGKIVSPLEVLQTREEIYPPPLQHTTNVTMNRCGSAVPWYLYFQKKSTPLTRKISHSFALSTFPSQTSEPTTENMLTRREFRPVGKSANAHIYGAIDTQCKPCSQRLCMSRHICMRRAELCRVIAESSGTHNSHTTHFAYWRAKGLHYIVRSTS